MRPRFLPDNFTLSLIAVVTFATVLPCRGQAAVIVGNVTHAAIALLFFLHGARLSRTAIIAGAMHWRLHLLVFATTFILFPIFGVLLQPLLSPLVTPDLYLGFLFLCTLPATVQSAIAFTSMARGNIPAAICSASASSILGIFVTPLLVNLLLAAHLTGVTHQLSPLQSMIDISLQLLLPFVLGQVARSIIGNWVNRKNNIVKFFDQGSILLVVYTAFSAAVIEGLWQQTPVAALLGLLLICAILLALALFSTRAAARQFGFNREDEITIVFCGSKKSLANGVPMANVLFPPHMVGPLLLPLMLFHQMQLMVCAMLAQRYARQRT